MGSSGEMQPSPSYYLKLPGIKGDATHKDYKEQIPLTSYGFSQSQTAKQTGTGGKKNVSTVAMKDMQCTAPVSSASPLLMQFSAAGTFLKTATLTVLGTDGKKVILTIELTDVVISSYQTGGSGFGFPMDQFSLSFRKIEYRHTGDKPDGSPGKNTTGTWDLGKDE